MDFIFYEVLMTETIKTAKTDIKHPKTAKNKNNAEKRESDMLGIVKIEKPERIERVPDCVMETVIRRMDELDGQIRDYKDMLSRLEAEYIAHANFIKYGPFEQRNLSHGSENMIESPQPHG